MNINDPNFLVFKIIYFIYSLPLNEQKQVLSNRTLNLSMNVQFIYTPTESTMFGTFCMPIWLFVPFHSIKLPPVLIRLPICYH